MPSSRQARMIRTAISPRFAIRILRNMGSAPSGRVDLEEGLPELDGLAVLGEDRPDRAALLGLDLVHQLHRLDDAEHLSLAHPVADLDVGAGIGRRRAIEAP